MSPQDRVERVLKEIHVTFSKSPTYNGQPDKMIIDRKHFLQLLDRLNKGIFDMMEQYEQTRQSRQSAERAFKRKGDEIIGQANTKAEDIYAASVIYTADAIGYIRDLMDRTNDGMNDLFRQFKRELKEQKDVLKAHESELQSQLADLSDTKKYLALLQEVNREHDRQNRDLEAEREAGNQYARNMFYTASAQADVKVNEEYFEKSGKPTPKEREAKAAAPAEKPEIQVNRDAAYFKWKAKQDAEKAQAAKEDSGADDHAMHQKEKAPEQADHTAPKKEADPKSDDAAGGTAGESRTEYPNPEFPNEEAILQAVLADEQISMEEVEEAGHAAEEKKHNGAGGVLKSIFFGDD